jgi:uncharacterized protein (TIGR00251 family)
MADLGDVLERAGDDVIVRVHLQPGAGRSALVGRHGDALKLRVAAPPVDGRANAAVVSLLAELLDLAPATISVVAGERSRVKRCKLAGVDLDEVRGRLERAVDDASAPPGPRSRRGR